MKVVHVKREFVLGFKVSRCQLSLHFGVDSRDGEANSGQHVVCSHPVHMVLVDLRSYDDPVVIVVIASPSLGSSPLLDGFRVTGGIFIGVGLVNDRIRVVGSRRPAGQTHRRPTDC